MTKPNTKGRKKKDTILNFVPFDHYKAMQGEPLTTSSKDHIHMGANTSSTTGKTLCEKCGEWFGGFITKPNTKGGKLECGHNISDLVKIDEKYNACSRCLDPKRTMTTSSKDWEKRFDKQFPVLEYRGFWIAQSQANRVKYFIASELAKAIAEVTKQKNLEINYWKQKAK